MEYVTYVHGICLTVGAGPGAMFKSGMGGHGSRFNNVI